ncbi:MAG: aromatic amino acid transport family protein [Candidatus Pacearchaeota archaeon]
MKFTKRFWTTTFTLAGTTIGAGILGLPYVFSKSGFFVGAFWIILLGAMMVFVNLCLGEVSLRTKKNHQLPGYAERYLGPIGKKLVLFSVMFGIYAALLAYLIGEGQSLSTLIFGDLSYSVHFGITFWLFMTILLREGLRNLKRVELYGVVIIISVILLIFFLLFQDIRYSNLTTFDATNFFLPFGVVLFSMLGFTSIPELRLEIKGHERKLKKAIILGTIIPIILYLIFTFVFVGVLGNTIEQISTLSFGSFVIILGIFTMLTSYFVLSFSLRDIFVYDLKNEKLIFFFVSLLPLLIYLFVIFFDFVSFIWILGIGGAVSGSFTGILILLMNLNSKKKGSRKPEYSLEMNWITISIISSIFIAGLLALLF